MLYLYDEFTKDYEYAGIVLNSAYESDIHRIAVAPYTYKLTFKMPIADNEEFSLIRENMVIKADEATRSNLFRVKYVDIDDSERSVSITAYQIFYDYSRRVVNNFNVADVDAYSALASWRASFLSDASDLVYDSAVRKVSSASYSSMKSADDSEYKNSFETLFELAKAFRAEIDFDGHCVRFHDRLGVDTEEILTTSKNISSFVDETNADEIVTRIYASATFKPDVDKDEIKARQRAELEALKARQAERDREENARLREEKMRAEIDSKYSAQLARMARKVKVAKPTLSYAQIESEVRNKYAENEAKASARKAESKRKLDAKKVEIERLKAQQKEEFQSITEEISFAVVVESPLINDYPFVNEVSMANNDVQTVEELYEWAMSQFTVGNIDKPKRSTKVGYEQINEEVHLGDTLILKHLSHNLDERIRVVETHYDPMEGRYTSFVMGEKSSEFGSEFGSSIDSSVGSAVGNYLSNVYTDNQKLYEQEIKNFTALIDGKRKEIETSVNEGIEKSKAEAEVFKGELKAEIDEAIAEATKDKLAQIELNKKAIENLNKSTDEAVKSANDAKAKIEAIEIPDVNSIVDKKIAEMPKPKIGIRNYALNTNECAVLTRDGVVSYLSNDSYNFKAGEKVYLIFDYEVSDTITSFRINRWVLYKDGSSFWANTIKDNDIDTSNVKSGTYSEQFDWIALKDNIQHIALHLNVHGGSYGSVKICKLRVLRSDVPFEHTLAPEDNDGFISTKISNYLNDDNGIVSQLNEVKNKFDENGNLKAFESFKNDYEETAKGTKRTLEAVKRYVADDGTIKDALTTHIENKTVDTFEREISKAERGIITKANIREEATGVMREYIQKVDNLKLGVRNYVLNSGEFLTNDVKFDLQLSDALDVKSLRNKDVYLSVDVETRNASGGQFPRVGWEAAIEFEDGSIQWLDNFTSEGNFKGRISKKHRIWDKPIKRIHRIFGGNQFNTGFGSVGNFQFEVSNIVSDYQPAHEDLSDKMAKYEDGVNRKLSELTTATNDNKTNISTVTQTADEAKTKVTQLEKSGLVKHSEINVTASGINIGNKSFNLNGTSIANIIQQDSEGTRILTEKVLEDGRKVVSSFINDGESLEAITDKMVVTGQSENYIREDSSRSYRRSGYQIITPFYENNGSFKLSTDDVFALEGNVNHIRGNSDANLDLLVTIDGKEQWWLLGRFVNASQSNWGKYEFSKKLETLGKSFNNVSKYRFVLWQDDNTERHFANLKLYKKKDASFIVDGTIKGSHLDMDSARIGILTTDVIHNHHLNTNSVTSDKMLVNEAMIEKLLTNEHVTDKLWANSAFITKLDSVDVSATRVTTGLLKDKHSRTIFDLSNGSLTFNKDSQITYNGNASIEFKSQDNTFFRNRGTATAFLHFRDDAYGGVYTAIGVNNTGDPTHRGANDYSSYFFSGIRIIRTKSPNAIDKMDFISDKIILKHGIKGEDEFMKIVNDYPGIYTSKYGVQYGKIHLVPFLREVARQLNISIENPPVQSLIAGDNPSGYN